MSQYTSPGDADRSMILQSELQKETQNLQNLRSQLTSGTLAANDAALVQAQITRKTADVASLTRELSGVSPRGAAPARSPQPAAAPASVAAPSAPAAGGIGDYLASMLRKDMDVQQSAIQAQQAATTGAGNAEAAVTMSQADRNKQILDERLRVQRQFSLGPNAQEDLVASTVQQLTQNDAQYRQERKAYDEMASTSFFDDPVGWLGAQLNRGSQAAKVNALADNEEFLTGALRRNMSLSEEIERTVQINTNEIDRRTAEFQATQQLQTAAGRVAQLQADGARANMSATALLGSELRKDEKSERQKADDVIAQENARYILEQRKNLARNDDNVNAVTGSTTGVQALNKYAPEVKNAIQSFAEGGTISPDMLVQYGQGIAKSDPAMYYAAGKLSTQAKELAAQYRAARANPAKASTITWKPADDEAQAWLEVRNKLAASNAPGTNANSILTGKDQDTQYNPLRADHLSFVEAVAKAAQTPGAPLPLPPGNLLVQMYSKLLSTPNGSGARNPINGQLYAVNERAILEAVKNMAVDGTFKLADGSPATPEFYAQQVSDYYKAASSWTSNLNKADRFGLPKPDRYQTAVSQTALSMDGEKKQVAVDAMNPTQIANWIKQEVKVNAGRKVIQQQNQQLLDQMTQFPLGAGR